MGITMSVKHFVFILGLLETGSRLALEVSGHGMMLDPPNRSSVWRDEKLKELFNATENWADNELYCGGKGAYRETGKCGICGDNYSDPMPRNNEDGGIYGQGFIVRKYKSGEAIPIQVNLTASHFGYFEIRLCAESDVASHLKESCYEQYLLEIISASNKAVWLEKQGWIDAKRFDEFDRESDYEFSESSSEQFPDVSTNSKSRRSWRPTSNCDGVTTTVKPSKRTTTPKVTKKPTKISTSTLRTTRNPTTVTAKTTSTTPSSKRPSETTKRPISVSGERITKFYVTTAVSHPQGSALKHEFKVRLPKGVRCTHCVMQWQYTTGNDWGLCEDGTSATGCGPQETFRNCADISIF